MAAMNAALTCLLLVVAGDAARVKTADVVGVVEGSEEAATVDVDTELDSLFEDPGRGSRSSSHSSQRSSRGDGGFDARSSHSSQRSSRGDGGFDARSSHSSQRSSRGDGGFDGRSSHSSQSRHSKVSVPGGIDFHGEGSIVMDANGVETHVYGAEDVVSVKQMAGGSILGAKAINVVRDETGLITGITTTAGVGAYDLWGWATGPGAPDVTGQPPIKEGAAIIKYGPDAHPDPKAKLIIKLSAQATREEDKDWDVPNKGSEQVAVLKSRNPGGAGDMFAVLELDTIMDFHSADDVLEDPAHAAMVAKALAMSMAQALIQLEGMTTKRKAARTDRKCNFKVCSYTGGSAALRYHIPADHPSRSKFAGRNNEDLLASRAAKVAGIAASIMSTGGASTAYTRIIRKLEEASTIKIDDQDHAIGAKKGKAIVYPSTGHFAKFLVKVYSDDEPECLSTDIDTSSFALLERIEAQIEAQELRASSHRGSSRGDSRSSQSRQSLRDSRGGDGRSSQSRQSLRDSREGVSRSSKSRRGGGDSVHSSLASSERGSLGGGDLYDARALSQVDPRDLSRMMNPEGDTILDGPGD